MNIDLHHTLLELFRKASAEPEKMPEIAANTWKEDSPERQVLAGLRTMLDTFHQRLYDLRIAQVEREHRLREREELYHIIFQTTSDAFTICENGPTFHVIEANQAACRMYQYTHEELIGMNYAQLLPEYVRQQLPYYADWIRVHGTLRLQSEVLRKDGTRIIVDAFGEFFLHQGHERVLIITRDITQQIHAQEQLREREEQYRNIFEATSDGLAINSMEDGSLIEVNPALCKMYGYTREELLKMSPEMLLYENHQSLMQRAIETISTGGEFYHTASLSRQDGSLLPFEAHVRMFSYRGQPRILSVVRDIAEQVQAQQLLEQRVMERTHELTTLLEVSHNVASTIELEPLLGLILEQLRAVVNYGGAAIGTLQNKEFTFLDYRGPLPLDQIVHFGLLFEASAAHQYVLQRGTPLMIGNVHEQTPLAESLLAMSRKHLGQEAVNSMSSWMGIPLKVKERIIGMLSLNHPHTDYFTPQHAGMALAIANQAAVGIENARLYEQALEVAALEERQHLARELHDSVSQALYGISLGAHTARTLLDRDPAQVTEPLNYVLSQAEAALTEMRSLIFELRPEALKDEGLVAALARQGAALLARHGIPSTVDLGSEPVVPPKIKQELYRIAQEALHNIVKHACANKVNLHMQWNVQGLALEIHDDGKGFDSSQAFPGHLGLHSMRERVVRLGGALTIKSSPGQGTTIRVLLPDFACID